MRKKAFKVSWSIVGTLLSFNSPVFAMDDAGATDAGTDLAKVETPLEQQPLSRDAIMLANAMKHCTGEIAELSKSPNVTISAARRVIANSEESYYQIEFTKVYGAPIFKVQPAGALEIRSTFVKSRIKAPDAPGGSTQVRCEILKP